MATQPTSTVTAAQKEEARRAAAKAAPKPSAPEGAETNGSTATATETAKPAAKGAAKPKAKAKAKPKAAAKKPAPRASSPYSDEVREAVKIAKDLRGGSHGAGPKQHKAIRDVVTKLLKKEQVEPTPQALATLAGFKTVKELTSVAKGEGDRTATAPMKDLAAQMPADDPWTKGRHLAAALAAWAQQLGRKS